MTQYPAPHDPHCGGANALTAVWSRFCDRHAIAEAGVPLFAVDAHGFISTKLIGSSRRRSILCRSDDMEALVLQETSLLVADWRAGRHEYDGLIYLMFRRGDDGGVVPLYIGKAETLGKGDGNLSANLSNLQRDKTKFARWGDNYAYHLGDLSAVQLPGHAPKKQTPKYRAWASALFESTPSERPRLRFPVLFWAKAWGRSDVGIWEAFGPTRLSFLEYLMIGVASNAFPASLLNREGHSRSGVRTNE